MDLKENYKKYHKHTDGSSLLSLGIASLSSSNVHGMILREERARERENCTTQKQQHWVTTGGGLCCRSDALCWRYMLRARNTQKKLYIWECRRSALDKIRGNDVNEKKVVSDRRRLSSATRHNDIFRDIVSAREGALWWWRKIQNINCRWSAPTTEPENIYAYCTKSAEQLK